MLAVLLAPVLRTVHQEPPGHHVQPTAIHSPSSGHPVYPTGAPSGKPQCSELPVPSSCLTDPGDSHEGGGCRDKGSVFCGVVMRQSPLSTARGSTRHRG